MIESTLIDFIDCSTCFCRLCNGSDLSAPVAVTPVLFDQGVDRSLCSFAELLSEDITTLAVEFDFIELSRHFYDYNRKKTIDLFLDKGSNERQRHLKICVCSKTEKETKQRLV